MYFVQREVGPLYEYFNFTEVVPSVDYANFREVKIREFDNQCSKNSESWQ